MDFVSLYDVALCREYLFAGGKLSSTGVSAQPPAASGVERFDISSVVGADVTLADGGTGNKKKRKRNRKRSKHNRKATRNERPK